MTLPHPPSGCHSSPDINWNSAGGILLWWLRPLLNQVQKIFEERGKAKDTVFIGHEVTSFSRQFLIEGVMDAVINQDVGHEANEALRQLLRHHVNANPLPALGPPRVEIFVRENLP